LRIGSGLKVLNHFLAGFNERVVNDQLGSQVRKLRFPPRIDLLAHAIEIPLHLINAD
jgi:hypothetical protein